MDNKNGVKVTYIETQFVTSDAAGFKSLVQRLTGNSPAAAAPAPQLHRPRPRHADGWSAATAGPSSYRMPATAGPATAAANDARTAAAAAHAGAAQPSCLDELHGLCDYTELSTAIGESERQRDGTYSGFPY